MNLDFSQVMVTVLLFTLGVSAKNPVRVSPSNDNTYKVNSKVMSVTYGTETNMMGNWKRLEKIKTKSLKYFITRLKSFVDDNSFYTNAFMNNAEELRKELNELSQIYEVSFSSISSKEILFSHNMFAVMVDATELMACYMSMAIQGQELLFRVIEMKVMALCLFDTNGKLDVSLEGYNRRLKSLQERLTFWIAQSDQLAGAPKFMRFTYDNHILQTRQMLKVLVGH